MRTEADTLLRFMRQAGVHRYAVVLEVGCGFGEKLELLKRNGYCNLTGTDISLGATERTVERGFKLFTGAIDAYDMILVSHIIEHFAPEDLRKFLDSWFRVLKPGGILIIAAPLPSPWFWDDPTHVKPYTPAAMSNLLCDDGAQLAFCTRARMELLDVWFRKAPWQLTCYPRRSGLRRYSRAPEAVNWGLRMLFRLSLGLFGRVDGWMGVYRRRGDK